MTKKAKTSAEIYYENRSKWIEAIFGHPDLSHADFKVLYFIAKRSGFEKLGMYWSVPMIARKCQCSTHSVSAATGRAAALGLLRVSVNQGRENFYAPIFFWL